jgi:hypothetical protein
MKPVLKALLVFLLPLIVSMCLGTAIFIAFGALLAQWLPLSLFQASGLVIGATLAVVAVVHLLAAIMRSHLPYQIDDDFDDEQDACDSDPSDGHTFSVEPVFSKVGRNDHCPCGSGKKFKNCCAHSTVK